MKSRITQEWVDKVTKEEDTFPGANGPPSPPPKKFKFIRVQRDDFKEKPISWMLCIDTTAALLSYLAIKGQSIGQTYFSAKRKNGPDGHGVGHFNAWEWATIVALENYDVENPGKRKTILDDVAVINDTFTEPFITIFGKRGTLHVNSVGGFYAAESVPHTILDMIEKDVFEFPIEDAASKGMYGEGISISQWFGGTHYYAKIGDMDVVWEGEQKWDTYDEASKAASKFFESLKVKK